MLMISFGATPTPPVAPATDDDENDDTPSTSSAALTQAWLLLSQASEEQGDLPGAERWLAKNSAGSIRLLLGFFEKLRPLAKETGLPLTAKQVRDWLREPDAVIDPMERIVSRVASSYGVKPKEILGASRLKGVMVPRQVAMYLAREVAKLPLATIGRYFNGRDHTTVMHATRKVAEGITSDPQLQVAVRKLKAGLK